jgi:hypothetical protein
MQGSGSLSRLQDSAYEAYLKRIGKSDLIGKPLNLDVFQGDYGATINNEIDPIRQEYEKEVAAAKKMRQEGFMGRVVLPGERPFELFKSGYESRNSGMPQVTQLFANGGAAFDMGLEGDLAAQQEVQGGLDPFGDTGSDYSSDVQKALYNPQGFQKGRKTDYMKKMLSLGLVDKVQKDKSGQITGIFSSKAPSYMEQFQMDPLGTALKAVVPGAGIVDLVAGFVNPNRQVYTGYNPKITRTTDDMGDDNNQEVPSGVTTLVNNPIDQYRRSIDIYNLNPNRYKLFG